MNITSKKVLQFYKSNPHFDINEMNEFLVDFITRLQSQTPSQNMNESAMTTLLQSINKKCNTLSDTITDVHTAQTRLRSDLSDLQKTMMDNIALKLYDSRDQYIKEFEKCINSAQNNEFQKHQHMANDNIEKLLDKLRIHFNDHFVSSFDSQFKKFSTDISLEFSKATESGDLNKFEATLNSKYDTLYNFILHNNHEFRTQLTKMDVSEDINHIKTFFDRQKHSSNKGNDGENKLESILNEIFPTANVVNTSGKSKSGDFIVERDGLSSIMFENKDYTNNVPIAEVDKFIRDIECINTHGIFLSQCSGISLKEDFRIDTHDNKIVVFLHNVQYSADKIKLAVTMLDHLIIKLNQIEIKGDMISEETMMDINKEFCVFVQRKTNALEMLKRFNKDMTKELTDIQLPELHSLLSQKYATNDSSTSKCPHCNREFKNAKGLAGHLKHCKVVQTTK